jgi:hypothetical protein
MGEFHIARKNFIALGFQRFLGVADMGGSGFVGGQGRKRKKPVNSSPTGFFQQEGSCDVRFFDNTLV